MIVRTPFDFGLFYHAMAHLLGREPDGKVCCGFDGFYEFVYIPENDAEQKKFAESVRILAGWLDKFEIFFAGSRCEYGKRNDPNHGSEDVLQIKISYPVEKKGD